jgi:hypothetical protein
MVAPEAGASSEDGVELGVADAGAVTGSIVGDGWNSAAGDILVEPVVVSLLGLGEGVAGLGHGSGPLS